MLRRVTMAAVVAVVTAAMAAPAALAQDDYSTTQVEYGQDVYSGTEGGTESGASGSSGQSAGAWTKFTAKLSGDNEVGGGDPDGSGTAAVKTRGTEVCYDLKWTGVDVTLAHIHKGAGGANGDVVVNFFASESPLDASSKSGCVTAKEAVVKGLASNPGNYYVNLHSPEYPKGAIRGQTALVGAGSQLPYTGGPMSKGLMLLGLCVIAAGSTLLAAGQRRRVAAHRPRH
jgi:CHRD domain/LPXTG cell wall anchor motif